MVLEEIWSQFIFHHFLLVIHLNKRLDSQTDLSQLQTFAVTFMFNVSL